MFARLLFRPAAALLSAALIAPPAAADEPADPLRLVPPGANLCLVVRDLRGHAAAVRSSPFAGWLPTSAVGRRLLASAEVGKARATEAALGAAVGITADQIRDDILGDAVVLASLPGPSGRPDDDAGLVFVAPRDPATLSRAVNRLNELQLRSAELKAVREDTFGGTRYTVREKAAGAAEYYLWRDGVFGFSGQERGIRAAIGRDGRPATVAAGLRRLGAADKLFAVGLDPRAFDAGLTARENASPDPGERAFLGQFRRLWDAADALAVTAHPGTGLELTAVAGVDRGKLPAELAPILFPPAGGSAAWAAVPADALFAAGGRLDLPATIAALSSFLPPDARRGLGAAMADVLGPAVGRPRLQAVLRGLGPDWAVWARPPAGPGWVPGVTLVVRLGGDPAGRDELGRTIQVAVGSAAHLVRFLHNQAHPDPIDIEEQQQGPVAVRFLVNPAGFPAGVRPAFALKGGYLVVASAPEEIARFDPPAGEAGPADAPLIRVDAGRVRDHLLKHRTQWAGALSAGGDPLAPGRALDVLAEVLEPFGRAELRYETGKDRVALALNIGPAKPLK